MSLDAKKNPCADAPLVQALQNILCEDAKSQSPIDLAPGPDGVLDDRLDEIPDFDAANMCTVNLHWHLGAEHEIVGGYHSTCDFDHPGLPSKDTADDPPAHHCELACTPGALPYSSVGKMCYRGKELWESQDPLVTNEYDCKYCVDMHVGLTYEYHWPHSNLVHCQSEWQLQTPFIDDVLCDATTGGVDAATALKLIFEDEAVRIGVEGQIFSVVNSEDPAHSEYAYQYWAGLYGMNKKIAKDVAYYKGSTTGDGADNEICRGTVGFVTWHVDRECHLIEAATLDEFCRQRIEVPADDMSGGISTLTAPTSKTLPHLGACEIPQMASAVRY